MLVDYNFSVYRYSSRLKRKQLFELGILKIIQKNDIYSLYLNDRFVGLWYKNEHERARYIIDTAFLSYKSLTGEV